MTPEKEERDREERIRLRALVIWREEGCPDGRAREHWEQAEREIDGSDEGTGDQPAGHAGRTTASTKDPNSER